MTPTEALKQFVARNESVLRPFSRDDLGTLIEAARIEQLERIADALERLARKGEIVFGPPA